MAKRKGIAPSWWTQHKKRIWAELQEDLQKEQTTFDEKCREGSWSWLKQQHRKQKISFAKLYQYTKSSAILMHQHQERVSFMFTITVAPPYRVEDGDRSFAGIMRTIEQQAESLVYQMRTISKSEIFKSSICKECAYKKPLHYEWALELQADGNVHLHATISLLDDVAEVIKFIELVHKMRNRHLEPKESYRDRKKSDKEKREKSIIYPLGRTHLSLPDTMKPLIFKHFAMKGMQYTMLLDKEDKKTENYFFPSLSPDIDIFDGNGTLLEFTRLDDMLKMHKRLQKYILGLAKLKYRLKTIMTALHVNNRRHNSKGKFNDPQGSDVQRELEDIAVFEHLGIKMYSSTQMTFPVSLYQKMRKQLVEFMKKYECLAEITLDWCSGVIEINGSSPDRVITHRGESIAVEPKREKIDYSNYDDEPVNEYALIKGGV